MTTISVPISREQGVFIDRLVKSGRAANKAHAVRLAIDSLEENELEDSFARALLESRQGKVLYGDPRKLIKKFSDKSTA
ncbi:MAG: hypothetical protein AAB869_00790 [Patescibacteria group bacterium]